MNISSICGYFFLSEMHAAGKLLSVREHVCVQMCRVYESCSVCVCLCWYERYVDLLCTLCQAPCNIFRYLKVFGLFKVVEGFGLLESSDNPNPQHTFLSVVHWQG